MIGKCSRDHVSSLGPVWPESSLFLLWNAVPGGGVLQAGAATAPHEQADFARDAVLAARIASGGLTFPRKQAAVPRQETKTRAQLRDPGAADRDQMPRRTAQFDDGAVALLADH